MSRPTVRAAAVLAALGAVAAVLAGCAAPAPAASTAESTVTTAEVTGSLTISAAASLRAGFDEIVAEFEAEHPGVDVRPVVYDGSSTLATQIVGGAPVDVFASADEKNVQKVVDAGLASSPTLFATNTLVLVMPVGNPAGIATLADLAGPDVSVVLCALEVPCGAASTTLLANAGVTVTPASLEQNVTAVLTKVAAGEADAGLVYATDVAGRNDVASVVPEGAEDVVNRYPIVALDDAPNAAAAEAFVAFVTGERGRAILTARGFGAP